MTVNFRLNEPCKVMLLHVLKFISCSRRPSQSGLTKSEYKWFREITFSHLFWLDSHLFAGPSAVSLRCYIWDSSFHEHGASKPLIHQGPSKGLNDPRWRWGGGWCLSPRWVGGPSPWLRHKPNQGWRASQSPPCNMDEGDMMEVWLPEGGLGLLPSDRVDFWA